ncbi:butyrophilin subfamily 3 member A1-like [Alosa sapidissima]|uniref:butyrophilin subfamily 3 member A1-like n=1 Tax=Alosa sapidissima TaxID=34773 RepID=UPI001C08B93B|nr:butyrophilin subfamily 3 member A1-like [Alosa sapidissima]
MWWLLLFVCACHGAPTHDTFTVSAPNGPLSVWIGSSIILPCSVSPAFTASLQVRWHRPDKYKTPVLLYENRQVQEQPADPQYKGRVSLIGQLEKGNVSLKLENVSLADSGEFVCFVAGDTWYEQASVHLIVKVMGSPPVLSVTYGGSGQVNITCVSDGWAPQPNLTWRNNGVTEIPSQNHHSATDDHGLVSVTSWLVHSSSGSEWVACSVGLPEEERKESRISPYISGADTVELERILRDKEAEMERLKQKSEGPWKEVFISFLVLLLLSSATVFVLYRKGFIKCKDLKEAEAEYRKQDKLETESLLKTQSEEVETLKKTITELRSELDKNKGEVEAHKQQITEQQSQLDESKGKVETQNQQIEGQLKKEREEVKSLNLTITAQVKELEESGAEVERLKQESRELQSELDKNKGEVEAHKQQITVELERKLRDKEAEMERLKQKSEAQVKELEERLIASGAKVDRLKQESTGAFPQNHALLLTWDILKGFKESPNMDEASIQGNFRIKGKRVQCVKPNCDQPLNTYHFVLCKDTFSSGQHYWEMRIENKLSWFVGVCIDTLRGQEGVPLTLQNGCWLLCYDEDKGFFVNTEPITPLQVTISFKILGVFLDCFGHSLTFYDAESHSLLCTFHDVRSAHPLVPVLSPGVRENKHVLIL